MLAIESKLLLFRCSSTCHEWVLGAEGFMLGREGCTTLLSRHGFPPSHFTCRSSYAPSSSLLQNGLSAPTIFLEFMTYSATILRWVSISLPISLRLTVASS
ncbi:hypothetical protein KP509_34G039500 [Ceratopteris richardii]|uniref:Uncharacterized protein n=1 Tax=Ceratopteris richardii TaxID=49495 RepID=A0A8T2QKC9_CERRI|nr:hypothetical protein KP509_34G039500 [Ceratopteris richardii]